MVGFSDEFRAELGDLMRWRRDVRRFRPDQVPEPLLAECLAAFGHAPSVGLSEPWRIVRLQTAGARATALKNFETANAEALASYDGDKAQKYARLKLSGMRGAPVQLAVFCDETTEKGNGLGAATMPEMRRYSVVCAITLFWLTLRARGLGLGWVSILDADALRDILGLPKTWSLVGYLCIGYPETASLAPELEQLDWESRTTKLDIRAM